MNGINALFHWGSAVAAIFLVILLLRVIRQRDLLRRMVREYRLTGAARRVYVETPARFLRDFALSFGIPCEISADDGTPVRIDARPFLELLLRRGIMLIRCTSAASVELHVSQPDTEIPHSQEALKTALGGNVDVVIIG